MKARGNGNISWRFYVGIRFLSLEQKPNELIFRQIYVHAAVD